MTSTLTLLALLALSAPPTTELERGRAALRAKDAATARAHLERCIAANPDDVACLWELGWAHHLERDLPRVVETWSKVLEKDPTHALAKQHLARTQDELRAREELRSSSGKPAKVGDASKKIRIRAVGDVMLGTDFPEGYLSPEDGAEVMRDVAPLLRDADVTFVNLEGPLCDRGETKKCKPGQNCYAFRSPTRYGKYLVDAGVDLASTANNHSGDFGDVCRRETEATLDALGIAWSGRTGSIASIEKDGVKIAMIGFHTGEAVNFVNDHDTARALVEKAAATHDIVIVSFHGGAEGAKAVHVPYGKEEFYGEDRGDLRVFTHAVVDAGADLVIGHGPHVLRGVEVYNDRLIAYSLGNFATYGRFTLSGPLGTGAILDVTLDGQGRFVGGRVLATKQVDKGIAKPDPSGAAIAAIRALSREDFPDTHVVVGDDGALSKRGDGRQKSGAK